MRGRPLNPAALCLLHPTSPAVAAPPPPTLSSLAAALISLCNACGIRFKKEERRASAAAAAAAAANGGGAGGMDMMHNSWAHHTQMPYNNYSSSAYGNEYGYMEDDDRDSAFLSWRLNVHCS
nr:GATA transcription factor 19-like [Ipomoea batatas]